MDAMDIIDRDVACQVCSTKKAIIRDGFYYCVECGTRCADTQQVFECDDFVYAGKVAGKKVSAQKEDLGGVWSSWHGYNIILCGLAEELSMCCSKELVLKPSVLKLWGMFLKSNRIAFYSKAKKPYPPALTNRIHKKDLEVLHDMKPSNIKTSKKKMKKEDFQNIHDREKNKIRTSFISDHFHNISQSQKSTLASQTFDAPEIKKPTSIRLTKQGIRYHTKYLGAKELQKHKNQGFCSKTCKCLTRRRRPRRSEKTLAFTVRNLYALLLLALRINEDEVQIGDLLRWCREDIISYGTYNHFFPDDMVIKKGDPVYYIKEQKMFNHNLMRITVGQLARRFRLGVIKAPDIVSLIDRYVKELELPSELANCAWRLVKTLGPLPNFDPSLRKTMPNYEAMAMAYIILTLKMIFGLDGITENRISIETEKINSILSLPKCKKNTNEEFDIDESKKKEMKRLFEFNSWMKYIEYRKIVLSEHHYPTKMRLYPEDSDNPELLLHHKKSSQRIESDSEQVMIDQEDAVVKSILEDIHDQYNIEDKTFPKFPCSLCPMFSNIEYLLATKSDWTEFNKNIIEEDFSAYSIKFLFHNKCLVRKVKKRKGKIRLVPGRDNHMNVSKRKTKKTIGLSDAYTIEKDHDVEIINTTDSKYVISSLSDRITVVLKDMEIDSENEFEVNEKLKPALFYTKENIENSDILLNECHHNYWIKHYNKFHQFSMGQFEEELKNNFPNSFSWLIKECAATVEMSPLSIYNELTRLEVKLIKNK